MIRSRMRMRKHASRLDLEHLEGRQLLSNVPALVAPLGGTGATIASNMAKATFFETSNSPPAITSFHGHEYIAWTGADAAHHLNIGIPTSIFGVPIVLKTTLPDTSYYAPALAVFNNRIYLAWTGTDGHLNIESSTDGVHFGGKVTLGDTSSAAPALSEYHDLNSGEDRLALAWTGTDWFHRLNVMSTTDGSHFFNKVTLNETSYIQYSSRFGIYRAAMAPALASFGGYLWLGWTGSDPAHHLNTIVSTDGVHFGQKVTLNETSLAGPTLAHEYVPWATFPDRLFIGWTGTGNNYLNYMSTAFDANSFGNKVTLGDTGYNGMTLYSPSAGDLTIGWAGTDPQHRLNLKDV
jgi:hypothetical protein